MTGLPFMLLAFLVGQGIPVFGRRDCSCRSYENSQGFGNCGKTLNKGPICFVNEPSNCKDLVNAGIGIQYSWEACYPATDEGCSVGYCKHRYSSRIYKTISEVKADCLEDPVCKSFDYITGITKPHGHLCDTTEYHDKNAYGHKFCEIMRDEGGYNLAAEGESCSDAGRMPLGNLEECRKAVTTIESMYPDIPIEINEENVGEFTKGCYVFTIKGYDYGIYFNKHPSGTPNMDSRQVCKEETKGGERATQAPPKPTGYRVVGPTQRPAPAYYNSDTSPVRSNNCKMNYVIGRGNDWMWGTQDHDNGKPGTGIITECDVENWTDWATVRWNNGKVAAYRIGAQNYYDLRYVTASNKGGDYEKVEDMYCMPQNLNPSYPTEKEAEAACSDNSQCKMFFDAGGMGNSFLLCGGDSVKKYGSSSGSIVYSKSSSNPIAPRAPNSSGDSLLFP